MVPRDLGGIFSDYGGPAKGTASLPRSHSRELLAIATGLWCLANDFRAPHAPYFLYRPPLSDRQTGERAANRRICPRRTSLSSVVRMLADLIAPSLGPGNPGIHASVVAKLAGQ